MRCLCLDGLVNCALLHLFRSNLANYLFGGYGTFGNILHLFRGNVADGFLGGNGTFRRRLHLFRGTLADNFPGRYCTFRCRLRLRYRCRISLSGRAFVDEGMCACRKCAAHTSAKDTGAFEIVECFAPGHVLVEDADGIPVLQRLREHLLQTLGTHGLEYPAKEFSAGPCKNAKGYGRRNGFCYRKVHSIRDRLPVCATPLYALCIPVAENLPAHERGTNYRSNRSGYRCSCNRCSDRRHHLP